MFHVDVQHDEEEDDEREANEGDEKAVCLRDAQTCSFFRDCVALRKRCVGAVARASDVKRRKKTLQEACLL